MKSREVLETATRSQKHETTVEGQRLRNADIMERKCSKLRFFMEMSKTSDADMYMYMYNVYFYVDVHVRHVRDKRARREKTQHTKHTQHIHPTTTTAMDHARPIDHLTLRKVQAMELTKNMKRTVRNFGLRGEQHWLQSNVTRTTTVGSTLT